MGHHPGPMGSTEDLLGTVSGVRPLPKGAGRLRDMRTGGGGQGAKRPAE